MKKLMFTLCVVTCIGLFSACEAEDLNTTIKTKNFEQNFSFIDPDEECPPNDRNCNGVL